MTDLTLTKTRIHAGYWEGLLNASGEAFFTPELQVTLDGAAVAGIEVLADEDVPGQWRVRVPIPTNTLSDGVQTFLFADKSQDDTLGQFTIITGEPLSDDIRAEVDLMRAELDMLKRAFRRHCVETM